MRVYIDLFSGIGGFALAAHWAGLRFDKHYFSEINPYPIMVYRRRFPHAVPLGDIRGINGKELRGAWMEEAQGEPVRVLLSGGFP